MELVCIVLFLVFYYLKPQEWAGFLSTIRFVPIIMATSIISMFSGGKSLKVRDFFRTPHDWAMYAFFAWVVIASPTPIDTFKEFSNRVIFYLVIVHTLTSWTRIQKYLGWWTGTIMAVAALALISEYIFDPLGSREITHGPMKDRLVLNISTVNNPNALGHSIVPVIPMLFYFCIWRRPIFMKQIGLLTFIIPVWCVYLTFSKGAYLAGAITVLATFTFGRPKLVQIAILTIAMIGGVTAVQMLPRMNELQKSKSDEAIQGRVKAFTYGREYYNQLTLGVGQGNFIKSLLRDHNYYKAAHSTYVQTGAELGRVGMYLFLLLLWTSTRTLIFAKTHNPEQERVRRILFVLLLTYCVSGWMVDFAYRPYFFMFTAAVAAFHRTLYLKPEEEIALENPQPEKPTMPWLPSPGPTGLNQLPSAAGSATAALAPVGAAGHPQKEATAKPWMRKGPLEEQPKDDMEEGTSPWMRLGILDFAITLALLYTVDRAWSYAIENF